MVLPDGETLDPLALFFAALLAGLAFLLMMQMGVAYRRVRNVKLLLLALGFLLFFIEGLLLVLGQVWLTSIPALRMSTELLVVNLLIVVMLYIGTVRS